MSKDPTERYVVVVVLCGFQKISDFSDVGILASCGVRVQSCDQGNAIRNNLDVAWGVVVVICLLYTSPSPRD